MKYIVTRRVCGKESGVVFDHDETWTADFYSIKDGCLVLQTRGVDNPLHLVTIVIFSQNYWQFVIPLEDVEQ